MSGTSRSRDPKQQPQQQTTTNGSASISYAIGPNSASPTRSPRKLTSTTRLLPPPLSDSHSYSFAAGEISFNSEDSVRRHLLLSQKHEHRFETNPEPKDDSLLKDTSINIASAFHQAATMPPNGRHTSSSSQSMARAPSVDRLPAPKPPSTRGRPPTAPQGDGEAPGEGRTSRLARAVSPLVDAASAGIRAVSPGITAAGSALFRLRPPASQQEPATAFHSFASIPEEGPSYDYSQEERFADALGAARDSMATTNGNGGGSSKSSLSLSSKRKPSVRGLDNDNRAYQPPPEDHESDSSDDDNTRRPKKGAVTQRALYTGVPSATTRRKPKRKSAAGGGGGGGSEEGSFSQAGPSRQGSLAQQQQPAIGDETEMNEVEEVMHTSADDDSSLDAIAQHHFEDDGHDTDPPPHQYHRLSLGQQLGRVAHIAMKVSLQIVGMVILVVWNTAATIYELVVTRPLTFVTGGWKEIKAISDVLNLRTLVLALLVGAVAYNLSSPAWLPPKHKQPVVRVIPDAPVGSLDELVDRLHALESAFVDMSSDYRQAAEEYRKNVEQFERDAHHTKDSMATRLGALETKFENEARRSGASAERDRSAVKREVGHLEELISGIRGEIAVLRAGQQQQQSGNTRPPAVDHKTEERIAVLEKELKDVNARLKNAVASEPKEKVKHVSADGKDLTQLVQNILSSGGVTMPDYALHYSGGAIDVKSTSESVVLQHNRFQANVRGRPPVTAIVPDNTVGNCWAFPGEKGQLGIRLSRIVTVSHVTIDHPAREVLFDDKSAPREFHAYIAVEGPEYVAKAERVAEQLEEKRAQGLAPVLPPMPHSQWHLLHVGTFQYDVHSPVISQTFEIPKEYRELAIPTGGVVVSFTSNWGHPNHTCVYRVRVHGSEAAL